MTPGAVRMKALRALGHAGAVAAALMLLIGWPLLANFDFRKANDGLDAVSQASLALPDQPSGEFLLLIRTSLHEDTLDAWRAFFTDAEDFEVIFEDVSCLAAAADAPGRQLAERYQAQLPENQMRLRWEDPTLLASKAEAGYIDVAVFSREMADALKLSPGPDVTVIEIGGGA